MNVRKITSVERKASVRMKTEASGVIVHEDTPTTATRGCLVLVSAGTH